MIDEELQQILEFADTLTIEELASLLLSNRLKKHVRKALQSKLLFKELMSYQQLVVAVGVAAVLLEVLKPIVTE